MSALGDFRAPHLDVPSDDPMQLSPDMDRHLSVDEDIDIDLEIEIEHDNPGFHEDDTMEEQFDSAVPQNFLQYHQNAALNDDEMIDDGALDPSHLEHHSLVDEDLEDAEGPVLDDDLDDTDLFLDQNPQVRPKPPGNTNSAGAEAVSHTDRSKIGEYGRESEQSRDGVELANEEYVNTISRANHTHDTRDTHTNGSVPTGLSQHTMGKIDPLEEGMEQPSQGESSHPKNTQYAISSAEESTSHQSYGRSPSQVMLKDSDQRLQGDENESEPDRSNDGQSVHPVIVMYQGNEMSLFPPVDQDTEESQTYFLDDESYAAESLGNLFEHCKSVLADSISDKEELEIKLPELGLAITESSIDSNTITLSQILDIFIQLSHHDGLEDPGPLYMELNTNYKFSHRLEYLMTAAVEGKGLSQLKFLNVPEDLGGDDEYDQENQDVTEEEPQGTNDTVDTGFEHASSTDKERELEEYLHISGQAVEHIPQEANIDPIDRVTSESKAKNSPLPPKTATSPGSKRASTSSEESDLREQTWKTVQSQQQATADDDDIIDYSDEEIVPEFSTRSSTLQGDGSTEKIDLPPAGRAAASNHINHDIATAELTDINTSEPQSPRSIQETSLIEEFEGTVDEGQEVFSQDGADAEEADDLDEIIDYDDEILGAEGASHSVLHDAKLEGRSAPDVAANATHTVASNSTKSFTNADHETHVSHELTSDIGFEEDDFANVPKNTSTLDENAISHESPHVVDDVDLGLKKPSDIDHEVRGNSLAQEAQSYHPDLIDGPDEITYDNEDDIAYDDNDEINYDDEDEIAYGDKDEITIPAAIKPAPSPPSLKRLRDHQDEGTAAANGVSPGTKKIRST